MSYAFILYVKFHFFIVWLTFLVIFFILTIIVKKQHSHMQDGAKIQITMLIHGESKVWTIISHDSKLSIWEKIIDCMGMKSILYVY